MDTNEGRVLASVDAAYNAISLYAYRDSGFIRIGSLLTGRLPAQIVSANLNHDRNVDLVVRNAGDGTASVYLGDGYGGFVKQADDLHIGFGASDIALANTTGNGTI